MDPELLADILAARTHWETQVHALWQRWAAQDKDLADIVRDALGNEEAAAYWMITPNFFWEGGIPYAVLARSPSPRDTMIRLIETGRAG